MSADREGGADGRRRTRGAGPDPLAGRLVDSEMAPLPGGAVEVWHCGVPMAHQVSAMRWTVSRGTWRPGAGVGGQMLACLR